MSYTKQLSSLVLSALLVLSAVLAWAQEREHKECDAIIAAPACTIPEQIPQVRPLPEGCHCPSTVTAWDESCWLSGREASAAQQLGEVEPGVFHWRIMAEVCDDARIRKEFLSEAAGYVAPMAVAKSLDASGPGPVLRGGYSGKAPVQVQASKAVVDEAKRLQAVDAVNAVEMMEPKKEVDR